MARCFQTAVHREWATRGGTVVSIYLIQFATAADVRSYTLSTESADSADPANKVKLTVNGVADGMYIADPGLDQYGNTFARLLGNRGNGAERSGRGGGRGFGVTGAPAFPRKRCQA